MKNLILNATGLMILVSGGSASADVVYSNFLNTSIATNYTGTDVNVGDGTLNLFFGGAGVANDSEFQLFRAAAGGLGTMKGFASGDSIGSGSGFLATGSGGSTDHLGTQFTAGSEGYLGFQLDAANYGWMRGTFTYATSGAVIKDWAYDNAGATIKAGLIQTDVTAAGLTTTTLNVGSSDSFALASALTNGVVGGYTNSLLKLGDGTVTLKGTNTYTGTTTVSGGKLTIGPTGTINNTSGISIGAGEFSYNNSTTALTQGITFSGSTGTLSGTGTIAPAVIITSGNRQTAGSSVTLANDTASVGRETFANGITYNEGSIFEWNLKADDVAGLGTRGNDYDAVNALSLATTDTKAIFRVILNGTDNFDEAFWNSDRTWSDIFTGLDGSTALNIADIFKSTVEYYNSAGLVVNGNGTRSFSISGSTLSWSTVPEPSSVLAGMLIGAGLLRRRRLTSC